MTTNQEPSPTREAGFSLLEVAIGAALTAFLLALFYGSTHSVHAMTRTAKQESKARSRQHDVLAQIRDELERSGAEGRLSVAADGLSVTYQKLIGAERTGDGISGVWSQSYRIARDAAGHVARWEGARQVAWGGGIEDLRFAAQPTGPGIVVTCVTQQSGEPVSRSVTCYPRN